MIKIQKAKETVKQGGNGGANGVVNGGLDGCFDAIWQLGVLVWLPHLVEPPASIKNKVPSPIPGG